MGTEPTPRVPRIPRPDDPRDPSPTRSLASASRWAPFAWPHAFLYSAFAPQTGTAEPAAKRTCTFDRLLVLFGPTGDPNEKALVLWIVFWYFRLHLMGTEPTPRVPRIPRPDDPRDPRLEGPRPPRRREPRRFWSHAMLFSACVL